MMKIYLIIVSVFFILYGCRHTSNKVKVIRDEAVLIDPVMDEKVDIGNADTLSFILANNNSKLVNHFSGVEIIPLETNAHSLIGQIKKIVVYDGKIYIHNHIEGNSSLMRFDMKGRYETKIERNGRGPGEYIKLGDFDIDDQGNIYLLDDMRSNKIILYDKNLHYIKEITLEASIRKFSVFNRHIWGYTARSNYQNDSKHLIIQFNESGNICNKFFPFVYAMNKMTFTHNNIFIKDRENLYINMPFTNSIFAVDSLGELHLKYDLRYMIKDHEGNKVNRFEEDEFKLVYILNDKVIIQTSSPVDNDGEYSSYMIGYYNKMNHEILLSDSWNLEDRFEKGIFVQALVNINRAILSNSAIICPLEVITFFDIYNNSQNRKRLPDQYKRVIENMKEEDNPILFYYIIS